MNTSRLVGPFNAISSEDSRFSLGFLSRGGGKRGNSRVKGGAKIIVCFFISEE